MEIVRVTIRVEKFHGVGQRQTIDCLVSSSSSDYKAWSGAGQNCNVFVRSAASRGLVSH